MPPKIDKVGCSYPYQPQERDFGSDSLRESIEVRDNIKYVFCGHVHTGIHDGVQFNKAMIYNVSVKNENYKDVYNVTYLNI
jgi:Icc-related predicted phosphoesterase